MNYSGAKNEIVIESARHLYEMCNEISRATFENSAMKYCRYLLENHNEISRETFKESQLKIGMKVVGVSMKIGMKWYELYNEKSQ